MNPYQSQDITELAKALISVQRVLQPAVKDATNPFVKNRYASLNSVMESCRGPLLENGIWLCQYPVPVPCPTLDVANTCSSPTGNYEQAPNTSPHQLGLVTKLTHAESGQWQSSLTVIPLPKADPQSMGSAITYARRYALSAMLGIVTEEDMDGEMGRSTTNTKRNTRGPKPSPPNPQTTAKANPKASPQHPRASQTPPHAHDFSQKSNGPNSSQIPQLHGVVYDSVQGHDQTGNACEVITATGNTIPHKDQLVSAGFRWNAAKKVWWRYAETMQQF